MSKQKYFLGIDWGKEKTGLALADAENLIATALNEIATKNLINEIKKISQEYFLEKIIFGKSRSSLQSKELQELRRKGFVLELENEDFSTLLAQKNIKEFRLKGITKNDNTESARIILQSWLDKNFKK